jgi:hypothetical protein
MRKITAVLLVTILASAGLPVGVNLSDVPWNQAHIKTLRKIEKAEVIRFFLKQTDPDEILSASDFVEFHFDWYQAGDGKYELVVDSDTGPDIANETIFWQDAPGKIRSQDFDSSLIERVDWYKGPLFIDLDNDGKTEMISVEGLRYEHEIVPRKFVPNAECPQVYRLRDGKYVEASRDFPHFFDETVLPQLRGAMAEKREDLKKVAIERTNPTSGTNPDDDYWQDPTRYLAALTMCTDKIMRVLGRNPNAGITHAREWMSSPDPVLVDDARIVFEDIGGHDREVREATNALEHAREKWPKKYY